MLMLSSNSQLANLQINVGPTIMLNPIQTPATRYVLFSLQFIELDLCGITVNKLVTSCCFISLDIML